MDPTAHKPLRVWMCAGDCGNSTLSVMRDPGHVGIEADFRVARVLGKDGRKRQHVSSLDAGHGAGNASPQFLPLSLERMLPADQPR